MSATLRAQPPSGCLRAGGRCLGRHPVHEGSPAETEAADKNRTGNICLDGGASEELRPFRGRTRPLGILQIF